MQRQDIWLYDQPSSRPLQRGNRPSLVGMQPGGDYGSKRGSALRCGGGVVARSDRTDGFGQVFARAVQGLAQSFALLTPAPPCQQYSSIAD